MLLYSLDIIATAAYSLTGLLIVCRNKNDFSVATVLAFVTALVGCSLRDLLLGSNTVPWINDSAYLVAILLSISVGQTLLKFLKQLENTLQIIDAAGFALLTIVGIAMVSQVTSNSITVIMIGVLSASSGVIIRDLFVGVSSGVSSLLFYPTVSALGGLVYVTGNTLSLSDDILLALTFVVVLAMRLAVIKWQFSPLRKMI